MRVPRDRPPSVALAVAAAVVYELIFQAATYLTVLIFCDRGMLREDVTALLRGPSGQARVWAARGLQVGMALAASLGGIVAVLALGLHRRRPPLRHLGLSAGAAVVSAGMAVGPAASVQFELMGPPATVVVVAALIAPPLACVLVFGLGRPGRFRLF